MVFDDGRDHRRLFPLVEAGYGKQARGVHHVEIAAYARKRLFYALELADGGFELPAHARIGAGGACSKLAVAHARGRQRDRTAGGKALHQHAPALTGQVRAANDPVQGHEHVLAPVGAILEGCVERHVARADVHARCVRGYQRAGYAEVFLSAKLFAKQVFRVVQPESQTEQRRNRTEGDVALFPGHAHAQHLTAAPHAFADDAQVGNRRGIRPGVRIGEAEAGDLQSFGQARQVVVFLFFCAVMQQQFRRSQRVGHHDRYRRGAATGGELHYHL